MEVAFNVSNSSPYFALHDSFLEICCSKRVYEVPQPLQRSIPKGKAGAAKVQSKGAREKEE